MSYRISNHRMDEILAELQQDYRIYAPVRYKGQGRYSDTDVINYAEIDSVEEIVSEEKSDFSLRKFYILLLRLYFTLPNMNLELAR